LEVAEAKLKVKELRSEELESKIGRAEETLSARTLEVMRITKELKDKTDEFKKIEEERNRLKLEKEFLIEQMKKDVDNKEKKIKELMDQIKESASVKKDVSTDKADLNLKIQVIEKNWKEKYDLEIKRKLELEELIKNLKDGLREKINGLSTLKEKIR